MKKLLYLMSASQVYYRRFLIGLSVICLILGFPPEGYDQMPSNIQNPVLPGVADAGVIRFNGEYYIGGVFTNGGFYVSKDLVKWDGPVHVFSMDNKWALGIAAGDNQIHASDINYLNGLFHMYWSVNYWGKEGNTIHIGHSTSPFILGPYKEPVKDTWFENRIDAKLFVDDDGKLYLYMVKFTDGNTIWVRPMKDPGTFDGEPKYVFSSLPNTWETLDNRVEEGPWVMKYRNRYYLMYNSNHTSPEYGNYALGVAEADSPLSFNHGNKYSYPLVKSNQLDLEDLMVDVLKYSGREPGIFYYVNDQPAGNWAQENYNVADWKKSKIGFGSAVLKNSATRKVSTIWKTGQLWVRKTFNIDKKNCGNLMLRINHDGNTEIFVNGQLLYEKKGRTYTTLNLDSNATALLKNGENVLAIHSAPGKSSNYLDVSLFDMKEQTGDDILFSPGQPNILKGPNGFEWWLIYMANKNSDKRGQYINRVHFFNKKMYVDAITAGNTSGYHPAPAPATFKDLFDIAEINQWKSRWNIITGEWDIKNEELVQVSNTKSNALLKSLPASNYRFESGVKLTYSAVSKGGIIAWWKNKNNWLKILLDQHNKTWSYILMEDGKSKTVSHNLARDFNFNVYHSIIVLKNAANFTITIDELPAPVNCEIKTRFPGKGLPGLYTEGGSAAFDGVIYTIGWDEFDSTITGWAPLDNDKNQAAQRSVSKDGLLFKRNKSENRIFKGDALNTYEFSTQVSTEDSTGSAGVFPVYVNDSNYLKAVFDFRNQKFVLSGEEGGKEIKTERISLENYETYYTNIRYTDFLEKYFTFDSPTYINAIQLNKTPAGRQDTTIEDIFEKMTIYYQLQNTWYPLKDYTEVPSTHPAFETISFSPVKADALKFVNNNAGDLNFYINKIRLNEVFRQSYNLRVAKLKSDIIFIVNGKEVLHIKNNFKASRVGLVAYDCKAGFNGITLFHLPD